MDYSAIDLEQLTHEFEISITDKKPISYKNSNWLGDTSNKNNFNNYKKKILTKMVELEVHKNKLNKIYKENINENCQFAAEYQNWRFNIFVNKKKYLLKKIFSKNLFASSHYYPATLIYNQQSSPNALRLYEHVVNLFNDFCFTPAMALEVSAIVEKHNYRYGQIKL